MKYVLDTHVWIWWHMNPKKLSDKILRLLAEPARFEELLLSVISPWEFAKLLEKKRLAISCGPEEWVEQALAMAKLRLVQLTPLIAYRSTILPRPFHADPADRIIVSTAREENAAIISCDERILSYAHCKSIW